jgi:thioredoxin reductase (NADPH)
MGAPVILLVMGEDLGRTEREIRARYGSEYEVLRVEYASTAKSLLKALIDDGKEVALVLVSLRTPDETAEELLGWTRDLQGNTKRALIVSWDDADAKERVLKAMTVGQTESWAYAPTAERDEQFHRTISELLEEWDRWSGIDLSEIVVVGPSLSQSTREIRDMLLRNGHPHRNCEVASPEGEHILKAKGCMADALPVVVFPNGMTLIQPTRAQLAAALGVRNRPSRAEYDVAIVGAGPAGLSAATYAASEGLDTILVEQAAVGGQAGSSSLIRNYLGFPRGVSGPELASRAYQQAWLFGVDLLYGTPVEGLEREGDWLVVKLSDGQRVQARSVIIATGMRYRELGIPSLDALTGAGVFYGAAMAEAAALAGEHVVVVGGGNSAGQAALHLAKYAQKVTMVVRGASFAESMSDYLIDEIDRARPTPGIEHAHDIEVHFNTELVEASGSGQLQALTYRHRASGDTTTAPAKAVFIFIGAEPYTAWLPPEVIRDKWGYIVTGSEARSHHDALGLETSLPGVFAIGDVRHGSMKRVASAVGEGSICIPQVHTYIAALRGAPAHL